MDKPSVEDIKELSEKLTKHYSGIHNLFKKDQEFYDLEFTNRIKIPRQFEDDIVVLPTPRDTVDTAVDHTDISNARVSVNRKGTSQKAEPEAEMLRKIALGLIHRTNVESDIAPGRQSGKHFWLHGLTVLKSVWDADRWIGKPEQKEGEDEDVYAARLDEWRASDHYALPIIIQAIHPANILPDPSYGGRLYVMEKQTRLVFDAKRKWPNWNNSRNIPNDEPVDYLVYFDKNYRCDLIDGEPILKIRGGVYKHKYNFIPYTLIESGLGNLSIEASPEKRYVGLLRYMFDLLVSESLNYSLCDILMKRETMKGGYITGGDAKDFKEVKQEYGVYHHVGEKDVQFHDWETKLAPTEAYAHLALTHDYISMHGTPRSLMGTGETGVRSGADRRLVIAEASSKFNYSKDALANGWANVLSKCMMLIKNVIPGDFEVWARTPTDEIDVKIQKSLMKEPFTFYVEFAPISEEDEYRRQDSLVKLWNNGNGLITQDWAWKQMSNVDGKAMKREQTKERIRNSPAFNQMREQFFTQRYMQALSETGLAPIVPGTPTAPAGGGQTPGRSLVPPIPERAPLGSMGNLENQWKAGLQGMSSGIQTQGRGGGGNR